MSSVVVGLLGHAGVWMLVLARVLGLAWTAPALATPGLGGRFRLALAVLLCAVVLPVVGPSLAAAAPAPADWAAVGRACLVEGLVGAALGWSAALIVAGARQAGELVGLQAGLSPAALLDPEAAEELTPLGHLYGLVALAVFLALDGPLALVNGLVESYRVLPVGGLVLSDETARQAFGRVGDRTRAGAAGGRSDGPGPGPGGGGAGLARPRRTVAAAGGGLAPDPVRARPGPGRARSRRPGGDPGGGLGRLARRVVIAWPTARPRTERKGRRSSGCSKPASTGKWPTVPS